MPRITYLGEQTVDEPDADLTLLAISQRHRIQHMCACGGNARCSTCRVMILDGAEHVLPRNEAELALAGRKGLADNIRLACQTRVTGPVTVRRLVLDDQDADLMLVNSAHTCGREARIAVLFSDIRGFTPFTEANLAYDVVHVLNRHFLRMGDAILRHGGYIDKYIGDAIMALFGLGGETPEKNCLNAVLAAQEMEAGLREVNAWLHRSFGPGYELRIGIGIHYGDVILGDFGHPRQRQFTALGDTVNVASRLEALTKEAGATVLVSGEVYEHLRDTVPCAGPFDTPIRGKVGRCQVYHVTGPARGEPDDLQARLTAALQRTVSRRLAPGWLRLAFHDACTYRKADGRGGPNGSIRLAAELAQPGNGGLAAVIAGLRPVKDDLPAVSWADLIAVAGAVAVEHLGGPRIDVPLGRIDTDVPDADDRAPTRDLGAGALKCQFAAMGLTVRDLVVLSGAHTVGRADGVPFTVDLFQFNNAYFRLLLHPDPQATAHLLDSDRALLTDAECRAFVELYARDEEAFRRDFAAAYRKMSVLGTGLAAG